MRTRLMTHLQRYTVGCGSQQKTQNSRDSQARQLENGFTWSNKFRQRGSKSVRQPIIKTAFFKAVLQLKKHIHKSGSKAWVSPTVSKGSSFGGLSPGIATRKPTNQLLDKPKQTRYDQVYLRSMCRRVIRGLCDRPDNWANF